MKPAVCLIVGLGYLLLLSGPAFAECDVVPNGTTILTPETRPAGTVIYNTDYAVHQVCLSDGTWQALGPIGDGPAPSGPTGCDSIGDQCSDGSFYIGQLGGNDIYATSATHETSTTWNNGTSNWTTTGFTSMTDGPGNTAGLVALADAGAPYEAAEYCDGLSAHGYDDGWYLPARDELNLLWNGGDPIAGVTESGSWYWSSSEYYDGYARNQRFSDGGQSGNLKNGTSLVRCVRR